MVALWSDCEREVWRSEEPLLPSEWQESAPVMIPANALNAEPGRYSFARTPYLREIADDMALPWIREEWVEKGTQLGLTRLAVNEALFWAIKAPGAVGYLLPNEDEVEAFFAEEVKSTVEQTPAAKRLISPRAWDNKKKQIKLGNVPIFGLYAGSIAKLGRRSLRYVICDEIDKYAPFRNEASPIQLLKKRQSNWRYKARGLYFSTPTIPEGNIHAGYEGCPDKREYYIRCPLCAAYQRMLWHNVKGFQDALGGTKAARADWVRREQPCYYECEFCHSKITDDHRVGDKNLKAKAVAEGKWISGNFDKGKWTAVQRIDANGTVIGERPKTARVGRRISSLLSPWLTLSDLAAEFIEAEGDIDKTRDFHNSRLAKPWEKLWKTIRPSVVRDKRDIAPPPLIVPKWATALFSAFDTQDDWFAFVIRAWGPGLRSQLVQNGRIDLSMAPTDVDRRQWGWNEVFRVGLESRFELEGGGGATPIALLIDSGGDRTTDVYDFSTRDARIFPTKGMAKSSVKLFYLTEPRPGVKLVMIDTNYFKSALHSMMHAEDRTLWQVHREVSEQYCLEMAAEVQAYDARSRRLVWKETGSARNEFWDCEVLQRAAAEMFNVAGSINEIEKQPEATERFVDPRFASRGRW